MLELPLLCGLAFVAAWAITGALRAFALRRQMLDVPNSRSSHTAPTPRGGGAAIVLVFSLLVVVLAALGHVGFANAAALLLGGGILAVVGWVDDSRGLSARWRFIAHSAAATLALYWLGPLAGLPMPWGFWHWGWLGYPLTMVAIVWCVNLYNFMDGIDGLAAIEAICVALGACLCLAVLQQPQLALLWVLAATSAGYLVWNFPPAKIFMGDVCSGWLGFMVAAFLLITCATALNAWSWLILFAVFVVDATWTLVVRWRSGENLADAHRNHAYQKASRRFGGHRPVTLALLGINMLWLWPLAVAASFWPQWAWLLALAALLPLFEIERRFAAGVPDSPSMHRLQVGE